jgi:DNA invertase Pin-like site-specific DNA recombinase
MHNTGSPSSPGPETEADLPAVAYIRVASGNPADHQPAAQRQRAAITEAADRLGIVLDREFTDLGQPGITLDRPGLQALLAYIAEGQAGYLIVATPDRLSRDLTQFSDLDERLTAAGVVLVDASYRPGLGL